MVASIPSPHTGTIDVGPFVIHMYGLTLLLAIAACVALTGVRYVRRGGDWDFVLRVAVWGVAGGIVGARLYHDITSWNEVPDPKWKGVFEVWKGGLGVWGGIFLGCVVGAIVTKRAGRSVTQLMDAAAPGLLLAQGIGRIGNWFNQELYGKPTDQPWGLKIDLEHRVTGYETHATFHPTFLYELIYDLGMVGVLLLIDWRFRIRAPGLFALYVVVLHVRALLRGAAADRSRARVRRASFERVGVGRPLRALDGVLHLVAVLRRAVQMAPEDRAGAG